MKIIISGDVMRSPANDLIGKFSSQNGNILWLDSLLSNVLCSAFPSCNVDKLLWTSDGDFQASNIFNSYNLRTNYKSWIKLYNSSPNSHSIAYIAKFVGNADLIVGFELSPFIIQCLVCLNIKYIDLAFHPIRFLDDLLFSASSNIKSISNIGSVLNTFESESLFYTKASIIKSRAARKANIDRNIKPNSLLLIGQLNNDAAAIYNGIELNIRNFGYKIDQLVKNYSQIIYKKHPYASEERQENHLDFLRNFTDCTEYAGSIYTAFSSKHISTIAALSSGSLLEAKYFSKECIRLAPHTPHSLNMQKCVPLGREVLNPYFWRELYFHNNDQNIDTNALRYQISLNMLNNPISHALGQTWDTNRDEFILKETQKKINNPSKPSFTVTLLPECKFIKTKSYQYILCNSKFSLEVDFIFKNSLLQSDGIIIFRNIFKYKPMRSLGQNLNDSKIAIPASLEGCSYKLYGTKKFDDLLITFPSHILQVIKNKGKKLLTLDFACLLTTMSESLLRFSKINAGFSSDLICTSSSSLKTLSTDFSIQPKYNSFRVNVYAQFRSRTGMSIAAERLIASLTAIDDIEISCINIAHNIEKQWESPLEYLCGSHLHDAINIFCCNVPLIEKLFNSDYCEHLTNKYSIMYGAWELEEYYDIIINPALVNEVWSMSEFTKDAVEKSYPQNVESHLIPLGISNENILISTNPSQVLHQLKEIKYFLYVFSASSTTARKNPMAAYDAFVKAMDNLSDGGYPHDYKLVFKVSLSTSLKGKLKDDFDKFITHVKSDKRVIVLESMLDNGCLQWLIANCFAYISLHRSEGYGLTLLEAMAHGKCVIHTNYSGNKTFANHSNSCPINYRLVKMKPDDYHGQEQIWAEADTNDAAKTIIKLCTDLAYKKLIEYRAKFDISRDYSCISISNLIKDRFDVIKEALSK